MAKTIATLVGAMLVLACGASARAHHSGSMYVTEPVWIEGTVVGFEDINPHTITTLEERTEDGQLRRWAVEGPARSQLDRLGIRTSVPAIGDVIRVCGFAYKPPEELSRLFPGVDFSERRASADSAELSPQFLAGHVLVAQDGAKRLWEPHGLIAACIRSSNEPRRSWEAFLRSDARAEQAWCAQQEHAAVRTNAASREVVEDINGALDAPCP